MGVRLTEAEKDALARKRNRNGGALFETVEVIVARHRAEAAVEAEATHREGWASYFDNWRASIGPEPLTVDLVIKALRLPEPPFGCFEGEVSG